MAAKNKRYKRGHFLGIGIALGIPFGIPIGLALGNIALGPALGVPIGVALGAILESKYNADPIELTEREIRRQKTWGVVFLVIGCIVLLGLLGYYFLSNS
jgi:hypothetical protein